MTQDEHDMLMSVHQVVVGYNGQKGLCTMVSEQDVRITKLENRPWKTWQKVLGGIGGIIILLAGTVGSEALIHGTGSWQHQPTAVSAPAQPHP